MQSRLLLLIPMAVLLAGNACKAGQASPAKPALTPLGSKDVPAGFPIKGDVKEGFGFKDAGGEQRVFLAVFKSGVFGEDQKSEISAVQGARSKDGFSKTWKLWDFASNVLESVEYEKGQMDIRDLDGDGKMEVSFWYQKIQDGNDPDTLKFFIYQQGKKFAIRGLIPKVAEDIPKYEKVADKALLQGPKPILEYANAKWDSLTKPMLDSAKQTGSEGTE
jgi:hypothetical protein